MLNALKSRKTKLESRMQMFRRNSFFLRHICTDKYRYPAVDLSLNTQKQFHFVGTIHLGTPEMTPLHKRLQEKIASADAVIVEADISKQVIQFPKATNNTERIIERYESLSRPQLDFIQNKLQKFNLTHLDIHSLFPWHLALILQSHQAIQLGLSPNYGIESQILSFAKSLNKPIIELEGQQNQLLLLQDLEQDGVELLEETIENWQDNADLLRKMIDWWLGNCPSETFLSTVPKVTEKYLLEARNKLWANKMSKLEDGNYLVAVGALHLFSQHNLLSELKSLS